MEIFQIFVKRWRSLCSNLGGIDPEKPYRATLIISLRTYLADTLMIHVKLDRVIIRTKFKNNLRGMARTKKRF